jgi:hypothetical protein
MSASFRVVTVMTRKLMDGADTSMSRADLRAISVTGG